MEFYERLKAAREKAGLSQNQVAKQLCVTPRAISRWEHGIAEPNIDTLSKIIKIYGISADDLII